jgi:hypothetical protein
VEHAFEAVEDEVQPVLELVGVGVAGLEDVLDGELGQVGYSPEANRAMIPCASAAVSPVAPAVVPNGRFGAWRTNPQM